MNKPNLSGISKSVRTTMQKHSPEILTGIGIAGMITTTVLAVKATPKALMLIEEKKYEEELDKLTPIETIKTTWNCYVPAAVTGTVSIACLIGASSVNLKRNAALATAYTLSETALKDYRNKVIETIGEKKEQRVRDEVSKEHIERHPVVNTEVILTKKGDTLFLDPITKRYFKSDIENIRRIINELNRRMMDEMYISLNEFYYEIGLEGTDIGDIIGWNIDKGFIDVHFSAQKADDETPCLVLDYTNRPDYNYNRY